jgi:hypothetical protein
MRGREVKIPPNFPKIQKKPKKGVDKHAAL